MKLKNIITTLLATVAFATGCQESLERHLAEVQVSSSYVAIPAKGGSKTVTVTATADWTISNIPEWLAIAPETGAAGKTDVVFTAEAATSTNEATVNLVCNGKTQQINIIQQTEKQDLPISTCAEVNAGEDGVSYRIKGTVTKITSTTYGNMYINDGTDEVYVYGTLDASGAEKNFASLGIEAGDIVTVEGPRVTYSGTIELKNVTVIAIEKSLIKVDSLSVKTALPLEGGEVKAYLTCKGEGVSTVIPEDAKSWISVTGIEQEGNNVTVIFNAAANAGGDRSTELSFTTKASGKTYSAVTTLEQKGAIIEATVEEFLAAEEGDTQYRVKGVVTEVSANSQYHNANITVSSGDFASSVLLYRVVTNEGNIEDLGIKEGDIVTVVGKRSSYKEEPQMAAGGICEDVKSYATATVAEFLAAANDSEFAVTGVITEVASLSGKDKYNNVNITIKDGENSLYLYRVTTFDKSDVAVLNPEVGATITVAGKRGEYNGNPQMAAGGVVLAYSASETPADELKVNPVSSLLNAENTELTVDVTCSGEWTVTKDEGDWITSYTEGGSGNGTIKITYPANTTTETREAKFTVTSGEQTASFNVKQKGVAETIYTSLSEVNEAIIAAGTTGTEFKVNLTGAEVTKICSDSKTSYIQDATGAIMVYGAPLTTYITDATEKTTISGIVTGTGVVFNGLPEVTFLDAKEATIAQDAKGICTEATIAAVLADFDKYLNCKVKLTGATVKTAFSNTAKNGVLAQGDSEIAVYVKNTSEAFAFSAATEGDVYVYPALYNTTKQVYFWGKEDFTVKTVGTQIALKSSYTVNAGETVELGATCTSTAALKYSSADETVATVSETGVVSGIKEGTVVITVSADAVEGYTAASATTTITVNPAGSIEPVVSYTLQAEKGKQSAYAGSADFTIDGITWNVTGNTAFDGYWRIGGKDLDKVDRAIYGKNAISDKIVKVEVTHGAGTGSITVNSMILAVYDTADDAAKGENPVSTVIGTYEASGTTTFTPASTDDWTGKYYSLVYNITVTDKSKNKGIDFVKAVFYK